jgi:hypothetical protein
LVLTDLDVAVELRIGLLVFFFVFARIAVAALLGRLATPLLRLYT